MNDDDAVQVTEAVVSAVSNQLPDLTDDQVQAVLQAWNLARAGEPLGTIRYDAATKRLAHRVSVDGVHLWRVTGEGGDQFNDHTPTLGWEVLRGPEGGPGDDFEVAQ